MYDEHYGLSGRPFQLTPDPKFWFDTATHSKAMAYLGYGLSQGEGFVVITGDPGAGKTTLMGHLLDGLDHERLNVIKIVSSQVRPEDLLRLVAQGLGVDHQGLSKAALLSAVERGLHNVARAGRRTLLVIDEAQALPPESLEELRMLSNFQAGGYALLQIFLLGQPEFRLLLNEPRLEQLRQRVIAMHHLAPMEPNEVEPYLIHRLVCVGWRGRPRFTADALTAMHRWSGGLPRRLNQLAGRVMLYGAVEQIDIFGAPDIAAVISDLGDDAMGESAEELPIAPAPARAPAAAPPAEPAPMRSAAVPLRPASPPPSAAPAPAVAHVEVAALEARIAQLEAQVREQDEALRRVLTLLVDWVEQGDANGRPNLGGLREHAA